METWGKVQFIVRIHKPRNIVRRCRAMLRELNVDCSNRNDDLQSVNWGKLRQKASQFWKSAIKRIVLICFNGKITQCHDNVYNLAACRYKSLIGGEQYEPDEENPMIGFRGCGRYTDPFFEECFAMELEVRRWLKQFTWRSWCGMALTKSQSWSSDDWKMMFCVGKCWEKTIHDIHCSSGTPWHILLLGCLDVAASRTSNDKHPAKMAGQKFQFGHGISTVKIVKSSDHGKWDCFHPWFKSFHLEWDSPKPLISIVFHWFKIRASSKNPFPSYRYHDWCPVQTAAKLPPTILSFPQNVLCTSLYHMNSCSTYIECWRF